MNVGVTGGTGFVGEALVRRLLADGHSVRVLSRRDALDVTNRGRVEHVRGALDSPRETLCHFVAGLDVLYHCAAEINEPARMMTTNVEGTRSLVDAAGGRVCHWVQLSSIDTFGTQTRGVVSEETSRGPLNLYEETKIAAEEAVKKAAADGAFTFTILRPSKIYGPAMRNRLLHRLITLIDRGWFFFIGPPGASANYIHVNDVVDGLTLCGGHPAARNREYNLSHFCSLEDFVAILSDALGRPPPRWRIPEPAARALAVLFGLIPGSPLTTARVNALVKRARYSTARIEAELGYRHQVPMTVGLRALVREWQQARNLPVGT